MANGDDLFTKMCKEATEELAKGDKGWKTCDTNTLFLACFGMMTDHLSRRLGKPLWFFSAAVASAVIGYLVKLYIGG